jgi:hypothetical protein
MLAVAHCGDDDEQWSSGKFIGAGRLGFKIARHGLENVPDPLGNAPRLPVTAGVRQDRAGGHALTVSTAVIAAKNLQIVPK